MARSPQNDYGSEGSVPNQISVNGSGAGPMNVHANPEDFGAAVGQGVERVGQESGQIANAYGGMILENASNQAILGYDKAAGDLHAKYTQLEGNAAEAARPQYTADLEALHQQFRTNLPMGAQKMFDATTMRSMGNQVSEYSNYAAGQVKSANLSSTAAIMTNAASKSGNLATVLDPQRFGEEVLAPIIHGGNALADVHGDAAIATGINSDTGNYSYPDTPEGKAAEARHLQKTNAVLATAYTTAVKTIGDYQGIPAATDWAEAHKNMMPDQAKVEINQYLAPKMKNEVISGAISDQNNKIENDWNNHLTSNVPANFTDQRKAPLDVIRQNEGFTGKIGKDSNGAQVLNGVNEKSFPQDYASIKSAYDKSKEAGDAATNDFYQKNILDKYDIKSLPANTQAIVADGLVNHGAGDFGQSLIQAAKNGASPQMLIDMRRAEYQHLADSDTDGSHGWASSLKGWNNRLDKLENSDNGVTGTFANKKEYYESIKDDYVKDAVNTVNDKYGDYYLNHRAEQQATGEINKKIAIEAGKLKNDTDIIEKAINGGFTKGQVPMTMADLQSVPGVQPVLDRVQREQSNFYNGIDTKITKASHGDLSQNSPNGYDAIISSLAPEDKYTRQQKIEYLSKGLGTDNPGYGISQKDFNDAKPALDLDPQIRESILTNMNAIKIANGNLDGKGQQRAVQWYNGVMAAYKAKDPKTSDAEFAGTIGQQEGPVYAPPKPSPMSQIADFVKERTGLGMIKMKTPNGDLVMTPAANAEKAIKAGYEKVE